jgi:hypothetical protein
VDANFQVLDACFIKLTSSPLLPLVGNVWIKVKM